MALIWHRIRCAWAVLIGRARAADLDERPTIMLVPVGDELLNFFGSDARTFLPGIHPDETKH